MTDPMQTDLHSRIMNLPRGSYTSASNGWREENAYQLGHRDARHAAAELANETASELRSLRDALALARSHIGELREALHQCLDRRLTRESLEYIARAALKEKGE